MADTPQPKPKPVARIQENLTAAAERRLLNWLCARLPAGTKPDHLTTIGMLGAVVIFTGYAASGSDPAWLWLAIAGYFIQWFGDSLDGSLARFRKIERPRFGYFIDHSCDGFATLLILVGIGLSPYVRLDIALLALAGYLLLSIHAYLSARVIGELRLSYVAAGPTELRLMLIAYTVAMLALGPGPGRFGQISGFDLVMAAIAVVLIGLFLLQTISVARRLNRLDPPPSR